MTYFYESIHTKDGVSYPEVQGGTPRVTQEA
jgi:hypothetical protein